MDLAVEIDTVDPGFQFQASIRCSDCVCTVRRLAVEHVPPSCHEIMVSDGIELIELRAFSDCHSLSRITFPSCSVLREVSGLRFCAITHLVIPVMVERIGTDAFASCAFSTNVSFTIPAKLKAIDGFWDTRLKIAGIPSSVEVHGANSYADCPFLQLADFTVDSHLRVVRDFRGSGLHTVSLPAGVFSDVRNSVY
jgi:hypothetical protein